MIFTGAGCVKLDGPGNAWVVIGLDNDSQQLNEINKCVVGLYTTAKKCDFVT